MACRNFDKMPSLLSPDEAEMISHSNATVHTFRYASWQKKDHLSFFARKKSEQSEQRNRAAYAIF